MEEKGCPYCDKKIEGYNSKQIDYLLKQHILAKHEDKVKLVNGNKVGKEVIKK